MFLVLVLAFESSQGLCFEYGSAGFGFGGFRI